MPNHELMLNNAKAKEFAMKRSVLAPLFIVSAVVLPAGTAIAKSAPPANSVPAALNTINSTLNAQTATINALAKQIARTLSARRLRLRRF